MFTITLCSFKGGTAKTSTALSVGACLAKYHKKRVLLVDFDSQANLSIGLGVGPDSEKTMVPVLQERGKIQDMVRETNIKNLFLIPANAYLDGIERTPQIGSDPYAHERLRRSLALLEKDFDFCFIDTPPSLGWLTQSAFFASNYNLICAIPEAYSVIALRRLKEFQESIQKYHSIDVLGIVLTFWDERGAVNSTILNEINASFPDKLLTSRIRRDVSVSRAVFQGQPVIDFASDGRAAEDYRALTEELLGVLDPSLPKSQLKKLRKTTETARA
jgi:chromosome partitioning protein